MAMSGLTRGAHAAAPEGGSGDGSRVARCRGWLRNGLAGASASAFALGVSATAFAVDNIYEKPATGRFKAAPKPVDPEAEAAAADAAAQSVDYILGIHVNTIFFIAAAAIAVLWFTIGGGRKPKVTQHR